MSKKFVKVYVHRSKENNWGTIEALGIDDKSETANRIKYLGYEVELLYEVDTKTGAHRLVGADGQFLGSESYVYEDIVSG